MWFLRREGFTISTVQAIDAARACDLVGVADRDTLRDAIASVVVERAGDLARYTASFERFFTLGHGHVGDLWSRLRDLGFSATEVGAVRDLVQAVATKREGSGESAFRAAVATENELDQLLLTAGAIRALSPLTSSRQTGFFTQRLLEQLGVSRAASALTRIRQALHDALGRERGDALADALTAEMERVRRRVRAHVEATAKRIEAEAGGQGGPMDVPFAALSEAQLEEVRRGVRRLTERLRGAAQVRRRKAARGHIDPHLTLRRSLRTGGIPLVPGRRVRRRARPRLWVLCDISESVRVASRFFLEFLVATQELFERTRSFVFVSEIGEVTGLLDELGPERALARIEAGAAVNRTHNSNYGRALKDFENRFGRDMDRRTTLVILGDGRTNYLPDEAAVVRRLRERARSVLWLCPEGPSAWTGDSAMPRYAAAVSKVLVARTGRELEVAAREVAARRA
ncbi:von Willebrand factor A [Chondromyces crocatus]|uniref:von Willebrand factor A n=1 Tax=Chondromyces crocatus TaxID=52 RepID=A0A0K1ELZ5_CHOCO|nr:von Willebrand factor A [Chondromyces crocatus]